MNQPKQLRVAIFSSVTWGLGHYCAHLSRPLSQYCFPKFITYPQIDLSGTVVNDIPDSFVKHYIKWPRFDLDDTNPTSIVDVCNYLSERNIKLVNIHAATTVRQKILYFTSFILFAKKVHNIKFVFTLHDVLPHEKLNKTFDLLQMFYPLADSFIVGNKEEKEKLTATFKIPESRITTIHHGIYDLFDRKRYTQESARNYLDIPKDTKIILFFGSLRPYKGFEFLIKAIDILSKKRDDFMVYVASGLKYTEKNELTNYFVLMDKLGIKNKFILNLNYIASSDIEAVFKASDVVALPYVSASQSGVLMASMGFKKPVVTTDALYDSDWIKNKAGLVAKAKDEKSFAHNLELLLDDSKRAQEMGKYGYDYSEQHFNWEKIAKEYVAVYRKTLK